MCGKKETHLFCTTFTVQGNETIESQQKAVLPSVRLMGFSWLKHAAIFTGNKCAWNIRQDRLCCSSSIIFPTTTSNHFRSNHRLQGCDKSCRKNPVRPVTNPDFVPVLAELWRQPRSKNENHQKQLCRNFKKHLMRTNKFRIQFVRQRLHLCSVMLEVHVGVDALSQQAQSCCTQPLRVRKVGGGGKRVPGKEGGVTVWEAGESKRPVGRRGGRRRVDVASRVLLLPLCASVLEPDLYLKKEDGSVSWECRLYASWNDWNVCFPFSLKPWEKFTLLIQDVLCNFYQLVFFTSLRRTSAVELDLLLVPASRSGWGRAPSWGARTPTGSASSWTCSPAPPAARTWTPCARGAVFLRAARPRPTRPHLCVQKARIRTRTLLLDSFPTFLLEDSCCSFIFLTLAQNYRCSCKFSGVFARGVCARTFTFVVAVVKRVAIVDGLEVDLDVAVVVLGVAWRRRRVLLLLVASTVCRDERYECLKTTRHVWETWSRLSHQFVGPERWNSFGRKENPAPIGRAWLTICRGKDVNLAKNGSFTWGDASPNFKHAALLLHLRDSDLIAGTTS